MVLPPTTGPKHETSHCLNICNRRVVQADTPNVTQLLHRIQQCKESSKGPESGLCILIEDISPDLAAAIDSLLHIGPQFFFNHLSTNVFHRLEEQNPNVTTTLAMLPSALETNGDICVQFRFQRVIDLDTSVSMPYILRLDGNSRRTVRRMPLVSGRHVGVAESCFSFMKIETPGRSWICMYLSYPSCIILLSFCLVAFVILLPYLALTKG
jgi:hypothetical protein